MALKLGELVAIISADDSKFRKTLAGVKTGLEGVAKFAGFGALAGSATTFAAALAPAVGAVAAAPAAFAAATVASFGLQMALEGVGDTLGAALVGDTEEFKEALNELPPSARAVVAELGVAFGGLQKRVQEAAFRPMREQARGLGDELRGPVQDGMSQVGAALGRIGAGLLDVARERRSVGFLRDLFNWTAGAIDGVGQGIPPLVRGLRDLAGVGLEFVDRGAANLGELMARAGRWLSDIARSGRATEWIENAVDRLRSLGAIVTNLGVGLGAIFSQAGADAGNLLGSLEQITARFAEWAQSAEGQQAAANVFGTLNQTASELAAVLPLLVGPLGLLVDMLEALPGGTEGTAAQFLAWSIAAGLITSKLGPLAVGLGKVGGAAVDLGGKLKNSEALRNFGSRLADMASSAGRWATNLAASAGRAAASFAVSAAKMTASAVATGARVAGTWAMMAARAMLAALRMAASWVIAMGPVGWAIAAVAGLVVAIVANWDKVKAATLAVWDWVWGKIQAVSGFIADLFMRWHPLGIIISNWDKIKNAAGKSFDWIRDKIARFSAWVGNLFTNFGPAGRLVAAFGRMRDGVVDRVARLVDWLRDLPSRILRAVGDLGSLLYGTGRNIVVGLWNGLVGMGRWLYDRLWSWIRSVIPDPIERALGIDSPSRVMAGYGRDIAQGLAVGIGKSAPLVARASRDLAGVADREMSRARTGLVALAPRMADQAHRARVPRTDLVGRAPDSSRFTRRGDGRTEIIVRFESDDADLLRRIRRQVRVVGGGNVQLAFGATSQGVRTS